MKFSALLLLAAFFIAAGLMASSSPVPPDARLRLVGAMIGMFVCGFALCAALLKALKL